MAKEPTSDGNTKPPNPTPPAKEQTVKLRYLGSSDRCVDGQLGLVFLKDGPAHEVSKADADRLLATSYVDQWETA